MSSDSDIGSEADITLNSATGTTSSGRKRRQGFVRATFVIIYFKIKYRNKRRCGFECRGRILRRIRFIFLFLKPIIIDSGSSSLTTTSATTTTDDTVTENIDVISEYFANFRPYKDNAANLFGVTDVGLPDGCQVEQAFVLHRHAARFPSSTDFRDMEETYEKLENTTGNFTGPMAFFNTWENQFGTDLLLPEGTYMEYQSGVDFWDRYGRILYNFQTGQNYYNATGQTKPLLRANTITRIVDSANSWARGFFAFYNTTDKYDLLQIPATPTANNTLASYLSCRNFIQTPTGAFDFVNSLYIPLDNYLQPAVTRLKQYMPAGVNFTTHDAFLFQYSCVYEYSVFASSEFCNLFTVNEWKGFEYSMDLYMTGGFMFRSAQGRAIGIGVLQELLARLTNQFITVGNTSVNTTYDNNAATFPMGQKFYMDMTHDFVVASLLTAMSVDYFREDLPATQYPPPANRHYRGSYMTPYACHMITEKIGCSSANPTVKTNATTQYTSTQYGYNAATATNKFIRMRLNNAIVPLATIRGGYCAGRTDGLCSLDNLLASQTNATALANYGPVCFGNYTYNASRATNDGNYFP